ncbi:MAG: phosphoribosylglycinamide formyltransferase [Clostridia bacterium]|jgi:phosphoribosylglycinamide formyltransferase-1|nr:phosphoribosylglycinamide formyltransferase [Clostridia bacterium]
MYNVVVFASGNGSTLQSIIDAIQEKKLEANIPLVVSNNPNAFALERAKKANIPIYVIKEKDAKKMDFELCEVLSKYEIDLIVLAGYLKLIGKQLLDKYTIINTHPSLLPKYGGKGMYGMNVHKAVINAKEEYSGVTLHYVTSEYDRGPTIMQTRVKVLPNDTAEDLASRVQHAEKIQLVELLKSFSKHGILK